MLNTSPVIVITGASSGIGAAAARLFAAKGYAVVLAARRLERLRDLADEIEASGGQALPVVCDVTHSEDLQNLATLVQRQLGRVDVLLCNAGFGRMNWLEQMDAQRDIAAQVQTNLLGTIWSVQAFLPMFIRQRRGRIVLLGSLAGLVATPTYSVYAATKFGMRGFAEGLRREVAAWGIAVSLICPGGVETEFAEKTGAVRKTGVTTPAWLRLSAADVAQAVWQMARRPSRLVVLPRLMWLAVWLNALLPGVADWLMTRFFVRRERPETRGG